jgi:Zn-dependent protease with chaperone function
MEPDQFKQLVARLEGQSAAAPGAYRLKVAALTLLGFLILALLFVTAGFGLVLLVGLALAILVNGGAVWLLLLKLGKLVLLLAVPLWYLAQSGIKALFVRLPAPEGREIVRAEAPPLFALLDRLRTHMQGPCFHHVLIADDVNASVTQRPVFGLFGWPRNYLRLGLPLLESMPQEEALAVIAHEYGHLAGSHGRFSSFIYRLRHTWGTVQAYTDPVRGWLGRLVAPLIRWYAPYFNAYTFVLARADEYQADAASARWVGVAHAARALKRVNLVVPRHERFMLSAYRRAAHEPAPPADLMRRWADEAAAPLAHAQAKQWLSEALDREGHFADSHPTLRARLVALSPKEEPVQDPPPALAGPSAAEAWLGPASETLRAELQARWAERVAGAWAQRHAEANTMRGRLAALAGLPMRNSAEAIEMLGLQQNLDPDRDLRSPLAAFNGAHPDHALGLLFEGKVRLENGEREGLLLLDRACELDPEVTKPACQAAQAFLLERRENEAAGVYGERWRARSRLEVQRATQLQNLGRKDRFIAHGLSPAQWSLVRGNLSEKIPEHVTEIHVARRVIPADLQSLQWVMGVRLSWWGRRRSKQAEVLASLSRLDWPIPLVFVSLDGRFAPWLKQMRVLAGARAL